MTHIELQAYRRFLMLKVSEAAQLIGHTDSGTWHDWEQGRATIPAAVVDDMQKLKTKRQQKIETIIANINDRVGSNNIRYFLNFSDFKSVNPTLTELDWRIHQSIATELFFRGLEKLC